MEFYVKLSTRGYKATKSSNHISIYLSAENKEALHALAADWAKANLSPAVTYNGIYFATRTDGSAIGNTIQGVGFKIVGI